MLTKSITGLLCVAIVFATTGCQTSGGTGALIGAGAGAGAGALIDSGNPWRGALIGAAVGSIVGYAIGNDIDRERERAARDCCYRRRVVVREISDPDNGDRYQVRAAPTDSPTRVTTTVTKWNPHTGTWEVVSESTQTVN